MLNSMVVTIVAFIFFIFFVFYKRNLLMRIFSINTMEPANQFQQRLEQTADEIIGRMENKIAELEYLLADADEKIINLEKQIKLAEDTATSSCEHRILPEQNPTVYKINEISPLEHNSHSVIDQNDEKQDKIYNAKPNQEDGDKRKLVLAMAEQGYNITEISKATGKGKGEIMLLLQLHKR